MAMPQIFRGGHIFGKFLNLVQILMIVPFQNMLVDKRIQVYQIAYHAGLLIHGPLTVISTM